MAKKAAVATTKEKAAADTADVHGPARALAATLRA